MRELFKKIRYWYYWNFKFTEEDKCQEDTYRYGASFMKDGKRINPKKFYFN